MKELIIFDMDGVIVQTHRTSGAVMKEVVKDIFNIDATDADLKNFYGISDYEFYSEIIARTGLNVLLDTVLDQQFTRYNHRLKNEVEATDGVVSLIQDLSALHQIAICSGSTRAQVDIVIDRFNLRDHIAMSVSCDDVQKGKPDPEGYLVILDALGVEPNSAIAVEDSPAGIEAAKAAGLDVIGFDNGLNQDISAATYQISAIGEVIQLIK
jgi:HAD superfamily hydrolase (TIGR01509 family)